MHSLLILANFEKKNTCVSDRGVKLSLNNSVIVFRCYADFHPIPPTPLLKNAKHVNNMDIV